MSLPHRRLFATTVVGALVAGAATLALATPAAAHNYLVSSTPEADAVVTELPERFDITTNDLLLDLGDGSEAFVFRVSDSSGLFYGDGCLDVEGSTMSTPAELGSPGQYTVDWQIVSIDGHPVADSFVFDWQPSDSSDTSAVSVGSTEPPVCGADPAPSASTDAENQAGEQADDADADDPAAEQSDEASAAPVAPTTATDSLSTVLWVGGGVLLLAALITLGVRLARAKPRG